MIEPERLSPDQSKAWRARQRERAIWTGAILLALVVLIFFVAMQKMRVG